MVLANSINPSFYYVMVVWGEKYVGHMLNVAIPCLLSSNNLPSLQNNEVSEFLIFTTEIDKQKIIDSKAYKLLEKLIKVKFIISNWISENIPYHLKAARGHQAGAIIAANKNGYCIFLAPDFLMSDGSLSFLYHQAFSGKEAVMIPGLRVNTNEILQDLVNQHPLNGSPLDLKPRSLVGLALSHIHEEDLRYNWDNECFTASPVVCTWNIPGECGYLLRAFHLHPILVKMNSVVSTKLLNNNTIDGNFLGLNLSKWDAIHVEGDSDNIVMFSLTDSDERLQPHILNSSSIEKLANTAYSILCNPLHRYYFTKAVKIHTHDLTEEWNKCEVSTGLLAYEVLSKFLKPEHKENLDNISLKLLITALVLRPFIRIKNLINRAYFKLILVPREKNNQYKKLGLKYKKLSEQYIALVSNIKNDK